MLTELWKRWTDGIIHNSKTISIFRW